MAAKERPVVKKSQEVLGFQDARRGHLPPDDRVEHAVRGGVTAIRGARHSRSLRPTPVISVPRSRSAGRCLRAPGTGTSSAVNGVSYSTKSARKRRYGGLLPFCADPLPVKLLPFPCTHH